MDATMDYQGVFQLSHSPWAGKLIALLHCCTDVAQPTRSDWERQWRCIAKHLASRGWPHTHKKLTQNMYMMRAHHWGVLIAVARPGLPHRVSVISQKAAGCSLNDTQHPRRWPCHTYVEKLKISLIRWMVKVWLTTSNNGDSVRVTSKFSAFQTGAGINQEPEWNSNSELI